MYIGFDIPVFRACFDGVIDDIRIYNRALSTEEIQNLFNEVLNLPPLAEAGNNQVIWDSATIDGNGSTDPDGNVEAYLWEADLDADGTYETPLGNQATVSLTYENLEPFIGKITEIRLTVTDDDGSTATDTMLLAAAGPCFCTGSKTHVESIVAGINKGKYAKVTVTVFDDCGNPVPDSGVIGTFTGDFEETVSAVTDVNGVAVIYSSLGVSKPSYKFCVNDIVKGTMTYDSTQNVETCESK